MQKKYFASIITVISLLFVLLLDNVLGFGLANKLGVLISPIGIVISDTGSSVSSFFAGISNIGNLQKENNELKGKLNTALSEIASLRTAQEENESLRRDLGFKKTSNLDLVPGTVTSFDPSLRSGINVRVDDLSGIVVGKPVVADGFLIGRVSSISGNNVKVALIVDSISAIPAEISGKGITGVAKGVIGNGLNMDQVPQNESVSENDIVITSGLGGDLPKGIIIAKVGEIKKVSGSIFQQVELIPMVDFSKIERVMIVK